MKKLFTVTLSALFISSFCFAQDFELKINEQIINSVLHITVPNRDPKLTNFGTGFLMISTDTVSESSRVYFVTNKHMLGDYSLVDPFIPYDSIIVDFYSNNPSGGIISETIKIKSFIGQLNKNIILHPNPLVDVAMVDLPDDQRLYQKSSNINWTVLSKNDLIDTKEMQNYKISYGEQVFAIGYPSNVMIAGSNLPIAKSSYVASSTKGNFKVDFNVVSRTKQVKKVSPGGSFFLVDGLIIGGNSGGPVISGNQTTIGFTEDKSRVTRTRRTSRILGIVSMVLPGTGIAVIYSSDNILELINAYKDKIGG